MVYICFTLLYLPCRTIMRTMVRNEDVTLRIGTHVIQLKLQLIRIMPIVIIVAITDELPTTILDALSPVST